MKVAIVGAGFTGLSAAYELTKKGHKVFIFEKDKNPGGLALGYKEQKWNWTLEQHYHHWFANDKDVINLAKEINHPIILKNPKTSVYVDGKIYRLDSPLEVLRFPKLNLFERLRMTAVLAFFKLNPFWRPLEKYTVSDVLPKLIGKKAYHTIWEPQLNNKFGNFTTTISLAWFWARIKKRTATLVYPQGGFLSFAQKLVQRLKSQGTSFLFQTEIVELKQSKNNVAIQYKVGRQTKSLTFDAVLVTLPMFQFVKIAPNLPLDYVEKNKPLKGLGAINLILRLRQPFLSDGTYWLSVCQKGEKVMAVVEHTNFMDKKNYNNEHLVYLGNYLPATHKYMQMTEEELLKEYDPFLKKLNPTYHSFLISCQAFKAPFAQPIISKNYSHIIPPIQTPLHNVYLANMQQVYPWDRGTNYAVQLGKKAASLMTNS